MERDRPHPADLSPRDAAKKYLQRRRADATQASVDGYYYRLKIFWEWAQGVGIERVGELRRYDLDEYYEIRAGEIAPATLEGQMWTLKMFVRWLEDVGAVEDGMSDAVRIPNLDDEDRTDDTKLDTDDAMALLDHYRNSEDEYGIRAHAVLEMLWVIGCRQGGLRALDLRDWYPDDGYVMFIHRPPETPLKNKRGGERPVALPDDSANVLEYYVQHERHDVRDEQGRQPLFASARGRPGTNTIRVWSYLATLPCIHGPCPHGKDPVSCSWTDYAHASKCPSSRSPHQIRTGTITYLLNQGWPPEDVAERVNSDVKTIEQHYDKADLQERRQRLLDRMEDRRRHLVESTEFTTHDSN